eukprot:snap_masked-scaffold_8-processed-gene-5.45-mRNA-1 protein AED:1.00 eAED:1.00 QI:0/-1/0/0/-1/1/1/0/212
MYPMVACTARIDYLILGHPTPCNYFTDHKNLIYILLPGAADKRSYVDMLHRWSLRLQKLNIAVRHIEGTRNVFVGVLSRWGNERSLTGVQLPETHSSITKPVVRKLATESNEFDEGHVAVEQKVRRETSRSIKAVKAAQEAKEYLKDLDDAGIGIFSHLFSKKWRPVSEAEVRKAQRGSGLLTPDEEKLVQQNIKFIVKREGEDMDTGDSSS